MDVLTELRRHPVGRRLLLTAEQEERSATFAQRKALVAEIEAMQQRYEQSRHEFEEAVAAAQRDVDAAQAVLVRSHNQLGFARRKRDDAARNIEANVRRIQNQLATSSPHDLLHNFSSELAAMFDETRKVSVETETAPWTDPKTGATLEIPWMSTRPSIEARLDAICQAIRNVEHLHYAAVEDWELEFARIKSTFPTIVLSVVGSPIPDEPSLTDKLGGAIGKVVGSVKKSLSAN
jgi:hypothetical protein